MVRKNTINVIIDLGNALEGSGIYSSATRLAEALGGYGYEVTINGKKPTAIVHLHTALPQSCYRVLRYRAMRERKNLHHPKVVIHGHTTVEDFVNSFLFSNQVRPVLSWYLPYYYKLADQLVAVSEHNKNLLVNYGIEPAKVAVISNGIRLGSAKVSQSVRRQARSLLGLSPDQKLVVGLGISIYRKGIDRFVDVAQQMSDTKFVWIGKRMPTSFLAHAGHIKSKYKLAERLPNCQFPGYVSYKTLLGLFNAADAFFYPTREENQGIAFLEAVLYGKPSVISNHPVFAEFIDGEHVLKAASVEEFVTQLQRVLSSSDLSQSLVGNARKHLERHSLDRTVEEMAQLYDRVLDTRLG